MLILWKLEASVMPITVMKKKKRDWKMSYIYVGKFQTNF